MADIRSVIKIRNIGIIAHIDAAKTTTGRMFFSAGIARNATVFVAAPLFAVLFFPVLSATNVLAEENGHATLAEGFMQNSSDKPELSAFNEASDVLDDFYISTKEDDERDFTSVVRQTTEYTCGPAALATAVGLMGGSVGELEAANISGTTEENGTTMLGLKRGASRLGYEAMGLRISVGDIDVSDGVYIAQVSVDGINNHFVVVKGALGGVLNIADPLMGNVSVRADDFSKLFKGNVLRVRMKSDTEVVDPITGKLIAVDKLSQRSKAAILNQISDDEMESNNGKYAQLIQLLPVAIQKIIQSTGLTVTKSFVEDLVRHPDRYKAYTKIAMVLKKGKPYYDRSSDVMIKVHDDYLVMYGRESGSIVNAYKISESYVKSKLKKGNWIKW